MESKYLLFVGIISLTLGIILRAANQLDNLGLSLIAMGVICKFLYIIQKVKNGEYKPSIELLYLVFGLLLFLIGMYCLDPEHMFLKPLYFMITGITLKLIFVIKFIKIIKARKKIK